MSESSAVVEKSLRSVFVGNIPYEATESRLKEIFSQVGPVASFKLMHDRESGKPKGYGFCEYKDQETALSAMRNLNAFEIGGRPLRVDNACTEKSRMEMQSLMAGTVVESPYGNDVESSQAPEAISNAVASLPPEQMFELMRQMQVCVRSNRSEARTMLLNNPQLAYALLQAQVVMRIIDPKTAVQLLHGEAGAPSSAAPIVPKTEMVANGNENSSSAPPSTNDGPPPHTPMFGQGGPPHMQPMSGPPGRGHHHPMGGGMQGPPPGRNEPPHYRGGQDFDHRGPLPPRGPDQDMRMPPHDYPPAMPPHHQEYDRFGGRGPPPGADFDQRDPRYRDQYPPRDVRPGGGRPDPRSGDREPDYPPVREGRDPRGRPVDDFRGAPPSVPPASMGAHPPPAGPPPPAAQTVGIPANLSGGMAGHDKEKAGLIMQVLQLSDEQIRMLPPEQQASIMQLKEQINQSQGLG